MAQQIGESMTEADPTSRQVGGDHYVGMAIEPVEYIHRNKLGFIEGCIVKYISRHRLKGGAEDILKIKHFCDLLLDFEYGDQHQ